MEQLFSNLPLLISDSGNSKTLYHIIVIIFAAFAAFIPRYFPILFFSTRKIPEWFNEWMKYVPVSLFTALVVKDIFIDSATYQVMFTQIPEMLASVIVIVVAYRTRSMAISVIVGLLGVFLLSLAL